MPTLTIQDLPKFNEPSPFHQYYINYCSELSHLFGPLTTKNKIHELAHRFFLALASPFVYPVLTVYHYIDSNYLSVHTPDAILQKKVTWLKTNQPHGWRKAAWKLIKMGRYESPARELKRLKTVGVLTTSREKKLNDALNNVKITTLKTDKQRAKMLMAQALEIKDLYRQTHHVFIHAQAAKWVIFSHLIKAFMRKFHPEKDLHHYKFLRAPCDTLDLGFLDSCWNFFFGPSEKPKTVKDYVNSKLWINDDDPKVREMLISADGFFYNHQAYESSLFFLINNDNIFNNATAIENFSKKVIKHFCPNLNDDTALHSYAQKIMKAAFKKAACGNLFVICLPKEVSHQVQYRSHPFGSVCKCHSEKTAHYVLKKLQEDEVLDSTSKCGPGYLPIPQFRLYAPQLTPGDGKAIHLLTPFTKHERKEIKEPIKKVVEEVYLIAQTVRKTAESSSFFNFFRRRS